MDLNIILTALITLIATTFIYGGIALALFLVNWKRKKNNPIDIGVFELNDKGAQYRQEVGRFIIDPNRGRVLVTCTKFYWGGIKEYLGYHITNNDFTPSKFGNGRQQTFVCIKDSLVAPLRKMAKQGEKLTDEERTMLKTMCEKYVSPMPLNEIPETLSLTPIKNESLRFALDGYKDAAALYNDKDKNLAATLLKYAIIAIVVLGIVFVIAFILLIVMGPDAAAKVATNNAQVAQSYIPAVLNNTLPPG